MMNEKNLGQALLELGVDSTSADDTREQTQRIIARDRRWVKLFMVVTSLLWIVAIGTLYWFVFSLITTSAQMEQAGGAEADPLISAIYRFLIVLAGSVEALCFALLSTFLLMHFSRRATLRQINANLVALTSQIEQLRSDPSTR